MTGRRYSRREFLKEGGRIGAFGALYASIRGMIGRAYKTGRDYITSVTDKVSGTGNNLNERDRRLEESNNSIKKNPKNLEETKDSFWRDIFGISEEKEERNRRILGIEDPESQDKKSISRRGFLKYLLGQANKHPEAAGIAVGGAYGSGTKALEGRKNYKTKKQVAEVKDKNEELEERVSDLEKQVNESDIPDWTGGNDYYLILGFIGLLFSIILGGTSLTGFTIIQGQAEMKFIPVVSLILLAGSSILIIVRFKKHKNNIKHGKNENKRL